LHENIDTVNVQFNVVIDATSQHSSDFETQGGLLSRAALLAVPDGRVGPTAAAAQRRLI